jgi:hypothetical protein
MTAAAALGDLESLLSEIAMSRTRRQGRSATSVALVIATAFANSSNSVLAMPREDEQNPGMSEGFYLHDRYIQDGYAGGSYADKCCGFH